MKYLSKTIRDLIPSARMDKTKQSYKIYAKNYAS